MKFDAGSEAASASTLGSLGIANLVMSGRVEAVFERTQSSTPMYVNPATGLPSYTDVVTEGRLELKVTARLLSARSGTLLATLTAAGKQVGMPQKTSMIGGQRLASKVVDPLGKLVDLAAVQACAELVGKLPFPASARLLVQLKDAPTPGKASVPGHPAGPVAEAPARIPSAPSASFPSSTVQLAKTVHPATHTKRQMGIGLWRRGPGGTSGNLEIAEKIRLCRSYQELSDREIARTRSGRGIDHIRHQMRREELPLRDGHARSAGE